MSNMENGIHRSKAKSNGDTWYGSGLGWEWMRTGSEDRAWIWHQVSTLHELFTLMYLPACLPGAPSKHSLHHGPPTPHAVSCLTYSHAVHLHHQAYSLSCTHPAPVLSMAPLAWSCHHQRWQQHNTDFFLGNKQRTLNRMVSRQLLLPSQIEH